MEVLEVMECGPDAMSQVLPVMAAAAVDLLEWQEHLVLERPVIAAEAVVRVDLVEHLFPVVFMVLMQEVPMLVATTVYIPAAVCKPKLIADPVPVTNEDTGVEPIYN